MEKYEDNKPLTDVLDPTTKSTINTKEIINKTVVDFLLTIPATIAYFSLMFFTVGRLWLKLSDPLSLGLASILLPPTVGIVHYLMGEKWETGKKKYGFLLIAVTILTISVVWYIQTLPPTPAAAATFAATFANGRTFTITLKPEEKYEVDKVRQGQQWSFPTFTGQFQSRVDTGDDSACWETVENTLPWRAEKSGTLQIRTGQADVKVTVNVQS